MSIEQLEIANFRNLEKVSLAPSSQINAVIILLGRFDVLAIGLFEGLEEVQEIASNLILDLKGVRLVETSLVVNVSKYDNRIAKIMPSFSSDT